MDAVRREPDVVNRTDGGDVQPRPWDEVQEHLPSLNEARWSDLRESIERDGVRMPILCLPDGRIIDGHHRYEIAGDDCEVRVLDVGETHALRLAEALNTARRQMTSDEIKNLRQWQREKALELRQEGATQEEAAEHVGASQQAVSKWEDERKEDDDGSNTTGSKASPDQRAKVSDADREAIADRVADGETQASVARDYGISRRRVGQIVQEKAAPEDPAAPVGDQPSDTTATSTPDGSQSPNRGRPVSEVASKPSYGAKLRNLVRAATRLGEPTDAEIEAIPANEMMLENLESAKRTIERILSTHGGN